MRTENINGMVVRYPDGAVAAFARNPIMIEGFTGTSVGMKVTNKDTGRSVTDNRAPFGGEVFFDLAYYMQVLFGQNGLDEVDYSGVSVSMTASFGVVLTFASNETFSFDVLAVWASELQTDDESLRLFGGYPFTIGVFADESHTVKVGASSYSLDAGLHSIPVDESVTVEVSTVSGKTRTIQVSEECGEGIYLRWVDKMGIFRYWLFAKGSVTTGVKASGEYRRKNTGVDVGVRRASKEVSTSVEICAPLVTDGEYGYLLGLAASPIVAMYHDGGWVDVDIEPGDIVRDRDVRQDFIVTLVLPETIVQKL